jgi:uncharacterized phosphosugar-binding protein
MALAFGIMARHAGAFLMHPIMQVFDHGSQHLLAEAVTRRRGLTRERPLLREDLIDPAYGFQSER